MTKRSVRMPALRLWDRPGARKANVALAQRAETAGFTGVLVPGRGDPLGLCQSILTATHDLVVGTNIVNLFQRTPADFARNAALMNELSDGRFVLGVGLGAVEEGRYAGTPGKPLADIRAFVDGYKALSAQEPSLAPLMIATLRQGMVRLAGEIADGATWANGSLSHMAYSLSLVPETKRASFIVGNVIRVCIDEDKEAAKAMLRSRLRSYLTQPQYPLYWLEAGYEEEMQAVLRTVRAGDTSNLDALMTDEWLADVAIFGSESEVIEGVEAWYDAGVTILSIEPVSTRGDEERAFEELFACYAKV